MHHEALTYVAISTWDSPITYKGVTEEEDLHRMLQEEGCWFCHPISVDKGVGVVFVGIDW